MSETREACVSMYPDGMAHHVVITRRSWRRTRFYLDGNRVTRRHPFFKALRKRPYPREVLGL